MRLLILHIIPIFTSFGLPFYVQKKRAMGGEECFGVGEELVGGAVEAVV